MEQQQEVEHTKERTNKIFWFPADSLCSVGSAKLHYIPASCILQHPWQLIRNLTPNTWRRSVCRNRCWWMYTVNLLILCEWSTTTRYSQRCTLVFQCTLVMPVSGGYSRVCNNFQGNLKNQIHWKFYCLLNYSYFLVVVIDIPFVINNLWFSFCNH